MFAQEMSVLVVEDDEMEIRAMERLYAGKFRNVSFARNADEGIEMLARGDFDVVLCDMDCPGEEEGRRVAQSTSLPVVFHSGGPSAKQPNSGVLSKPVNINEMIESLLKACKEREL